MKTYLKKGSILLVILVTLSTTAMAQIGVRGGYSLTNWKGFVLASADFESEPLNAFHLGLYGEVNITNAIKLEPGLYYSRKGAGGSFTDSDNEYLIENKAAYLDVPLLLKFYFDGFNIFGGPQIGLLINNEIETTVTDINSGQNISSATDTQDQFNDTAVDFVLGIGYKFDHGLNFNITYDIGFTNILVTEDALQTNGVYGSYYTWLEAQNRVLKISVGMFF
ncbi:MAG: porin family protein [Cyclobacteriaceae bacterium]